jgi:hypothetical protein
MRWRGAVSRASTVLSLTNLPYFLTEKFCLFLNLQYGVHHQLATLPILLQVLIQYNLILSTLTLRRARKRPQFELPSLILLHLVVGDIVLTFLALLAVLTILTILTFLTFLTFLTVLTPFTALSLSLLPNTHCWKAFEVAILYFAS